MDDEQKESIALLIKYAKYIPWSVKDYLRFLRRGYVGRLFRQNRLPESLKPINLRRLIAVSETEGFSQWGYQN